MSISVNLSIRGQDQPGGQKIDPDGCAESEWAVNSEQKRTRVIAY
jgi:hypothetical protein